MKTRRYLLSVTTTATLLVLTCFSSAQALITVGNITGNTEEFSWSLDWDGFVNTLEKFTPPNQNEFKAWKASANFFGSVPEDVYSSVFFSTPTNHTSHPPGKDHDLDGESGGFPDLVLKPKPGNFLLVGESIMNQVQVKHPSGEIQGGHSDLYTIIFSPKNFNSNTGKNQGGNFLFTGKHLASPVPVPAPEPSSILSILAIGTLGAASTLKRKLKPSQSTEKETTKVG